jgi:hypothetical protein
MAVTQLTRWTGGNRDAVVTLGIRAKALAAHIGQWNPHMDIDLTPVVDDEESAAI